MTYNHDNQEKEKQPYHEFLQDVLTCSPSDLEELTQDSDKKARELEFSMQERRRLMGLTEGFYS